MVFLAKTENPVILRFQHSSKMGEEKEEELGKFEEDEGFPFLEVSREEKAQNAARPFDSKKNCWIPDAEDGKLF